MLVVMADIKLKSGAEEEFKNWFAESNLNLSKINGFISRRLLKSNDDKYRIIVEHENNETFASMMQNEEHAKIQSKAFSFMESPPMPKIYNVVAS